jgi:poly(3-hydroxybutyrate) depolymerase
MMYQMYQAYADMAAPFRLMARATSSLLHSSGGGTFGGPILPRLAAANDLLSETQLRHRRPPFGITQTTALGQVVGVEEEVTLATPFATLLHFKKAIRTPQPRVLLVAPMSGHFSTLLRGTVQTMLPEHDVYLTDWHNARDISIGHGRFGVDDFIDHVIRFLEEIGPDSHVVAVCQPCAPVLAAAAVMAEAGNPAQPRSMTLMAGPVDARRNPTKVNVLATSRSMEFFEKLLSYVPFGQAGALRRVYPGFLQLLAFMSMNVERHQKAHLALFDHLAAGEREKAQVIRTFYDEYFSVADLPAEFYLETVRTIFQDHLLARGRFEWRGRAVHPQAIKKTFLLTVEGERDDVCGLGQTLAAHDLCSGLRPYLKRHHMQAGVGHYGVFSGARWSSLIYPVVKNTILAAASRAPAG